MSISNLVKAHAHKAHGLPQENLPHSDPKALGGAGQGDQAGLASWYEDAYAYYQNVQNGTEPKPEQAEWTEFMNQMNWAYQQIWGAGAGASQWGDAMGGEGLPGTNDSFSDPFGGKVGPNGDIIYDSKDAQVGFLGDGKTRHFFSHNIDINVASTSANVSIIEVMDESLDPPEKVWKVIVDNPIMGEKDVYIIHDPEDVESLNIMTPDEDQVDIQVQSDAVQWKEFVEGGMSDGSGMPEGADVDNGVATHDGVMGQFLDFQPPFGNIDHHIVYGDLNISVKASDEVIVEQLANGGYEITVTDRDGKRTTFELKDGFKLNLNAHPNNVTFKHGAKGPSASGDLKMAGGDDAPGASNNGPWNGVDGVPEGFEGVSLNGVEGSTAEPEHANPDHETWPPEFKDLLHEMGIDWETTAVNLPENLIEEIKNGVMPPSQDLLNALLENDSQLKTAWENAKGSDSAFKWSQARDRLVDLLETLFPNADVSADGELPEEVELDELQAAQTIFFNGQFPFTMKEKGSGKIGLSEIDVGKLEDEADETGLGAYGDAKVEEFSENIDQLADVLGISREDLIEKIGDMSTEERGHLWHILDYTLNRNFMPWDLQYLFPVLTSLDPALEQALNAFQGSGSADASYALIRDRLVPLLQVLYPNGAVAAGDDNDNIVFFGEQYDIVDQDFGTISNPWDWLRWKD